MCLFIAHVVLVLFGVVCVFARVFASLFVGWLVYLLAFVSVNMFVVCSFWGQLSKLIPELHVYIYLYMSLRVLF